MRQFVFLAIFVAAFVTLCGSFTSAENVATISEEDAENKAFDFTKITEKRAVRGAQESQEDQDGTEEERGWNMKTTPFSEIWSKFRGKAPLQRTPSIPRTSVHPQPNSQQVANVAQKVQKKPRSTWGKIFIALKILAGVGFAAAVFGAIYGLGGMMSDYY